MMKHHHHHHDLIELTASRHIDIADIDAITAIAVTDTLILPR